ncbi:MAG: hypothetical protein PVJ68_16815 [Candidatus Thiodiazotropha sp.]|jgi:hypothetical protein
MVGHRGQGDRRLRCLDAGGVERALRLKGLIQLDPVKGEPRKTATRLAGGRISFTKSARIVLVEDDAAQRLLVAAYLEQADFRVSHVNDDCPDLLRFASYRILTFSDY